MKYSFVFIVGVLFSLTVSSQIIPDWVSSYGGNPNMQYFVNDLVVDSEGNSFIYGIELDSTYSVGKVIKYNSAGILQWEVSRDSISSIGKIAIDANDNVYVVSSIYHQGHSNDYITIKYSSNGVTQWEAIFDGPPNETDIPYAILVDDMMNVYVTGSSTGDGPGSNADYDYATVKYDSAGNELWVARYNSNYNYPGDIPKDICIDSAYNVYVTGSSRDTINGSNLTIKYDINGNQIWEKRYDGGYTGGGEFIKILNNNCIFVGGSISKPGWSDYSCIKYDLDGNLLWDNIYSNDSIAYGWDIPSDMTIDSKGNVYMTGTIFWSVGVNDDFGTVKFDSTGNIAWARTYNGGTGWDDPYSIACDDNENVYVVGRSIDSIIGIEIMTTIKYNVDGEIVWQAKYYTSNEAKHYPAKIALDSNNNIYISGHCLSSNSPHFFTLRYNHSSSNLIGEKVQNKKTLFYPNPATDFLYTQSKDITSIEIYNLAGQKTLIANNTNTIDISSLDNGIYIIKAIYGQGNRTINTKLIKR